MDKATPDQLNQIAQILAGQIQEQYKVTEFVTKVGFKCFTKCITEPGLQLSNAEKNCISNCCDKYYLTRAFVNEKLQTAEYENEEEH
jgi:import inner membrane translocase subunit TIM13